MEMDERELWCYLEGSKDYFLVSIPITQSIDSLRRKVYTEQNNLFIGYADAHLVLMKVR